MTYERFEDLPVWKDAIAFAHAVFNVVEDRAFTPLGDLRSQLQRAGLSISLNIAEGFERGTTAELLSYIYIARGSAGECRSALIFAAARPTLSNFKSEISNLIPKAESISRQLRGWAASLQNSDIPGQRRLTEQSQSEYRQRQRATEFLEKLNEIRAKSNPPQDTPP